MSYSRQSCNGTTVENIDGKVFVNGVEISTGKLRSNYYIVTGILSGFTFLIGFIVGSIL